MKSQHKQTKRETDRETLLKLDQSEGGWRGGEKNIKFSSVSHGVKGTGKPKTWKEEMDTPCPLL